MTIKRILIYFLLVIVLLVAGRFAYLRIAHGYDLHYKLTIAYAKVRMKWFEITQDAQDIDKSSLDDSTLITFKTTECYGMCPVYTLSLFGSGRAEFKGEKFVCKQDQVLQLDKTVIRNLVKKLKLIGFENYPDFQRVDVTDNQTYQISLKYKNQQHSINHYRGDLSAPTELALVERDILAVADKMAVFGTYSPEGLVCTMEGRAADLIPWQHWNQPAEVPAIDLPEPALNPSEIESNHPAP